MISVVCPFFNEELLLDASVRLTLSNLDQPADVFHLDPGQCTHDLLGVEEQLVVQGVEAVDLGITRQPA